MCFLSGLGRGLKPAISAGIQSRYFRWLKDQLRRETKTYYSQIPSKLDFREEPAGPDVSILNF